MSEEFTAMQIIVAKLENIKSRANDLSGAINNIYPILESLEAKADKDRELLNKIVKTFNENWVLIDDDEDMPLPLADIILVLKEAKLYLDNLDT